MNFYHTPTLPESTEGLNATGITKWPDVVGNTSVDIARQRTCDDFHVVWEFYVISRVIAL